jgi:hypothetical protein
MEKTKIFTGGVGAANCGWGIAKGSKHPKNRINLSNY